MDKKTKYAIKTGFVIALSGTVLMLLLLAIHMVGPKAIENDMFMIGGTILFIALYLFLLLGIGKSILAYKNNNGGKISFLQAFKNGMWVSLSTAVFAVVFTIIFYEYIYTTYIEDMTEVLIKKMSQQNIPAQELTQKVNEQTKYYSTTMQAQFSFVGNLITGGAFSLIMSLFFKSKE
ncbi:DUF4199 domain-containing protein [Aquimarina rhabdastrellae]